VDTGETPEQALAREGKEESGMTVEDQRLLFEEELDWNWCSQGASEHHWYVYACEVSGDIKQNDEEEKSIGWYTKDEIKQLSLEPAWEYWFKKLKII